MRKYLGWILAVLTWLVSFIVLWSALLGVSLPTICGIGPAPWWRQVEIAAFAPTLWVTAPLHQALRLHDLGHLITMASFIETIFLASLYAWLVFNAVRGQLKARLATLWRRRKVGLVAAGVLLGAVSAGARYEGRRLDFRQELAVTEGTPEVRTLAPAGVAKIVVISTRLVEEPVVPGDLVAIPRSSGPPLVLGLEDQDLSNRRVGRIHTFELTGEALQPLASFEISLAKYSRPHLEPLTTLPLARAGWVLLLVDSGGELRLWSPEGEQARLVSFHHEAASLVPLAWKGGVLLAGMVYTRPDLPPEVAQTRTIERPVWAESSLAVASLDPQSGAVTLRGVAGPFGDHATRNVDAVLGADGKMHLLATEVLVANNNSSRVHHLVFEPEARRWESKEVLLVRQRFTSYAHPRLIRRIEGTTETIDALWVCSDLTNHSPEDGLYAHRLGEAVVTHLSEQDGAFSAVHLKGEKGDLLVALAPERSKTLEWFLLNDGRWQKLGTTDIPSGGLVHALGQPDGFAMWQEGDLVRIAFGHADGLLVQTVRWERGE